MAMEKTFDAQEAESRIYAKWETEGRFKAGANASRDESFTIMIPPPNVTGALHMGHAFNNTLQDILTRWHRMRGYNTLWQPGQDHAGIATQLQVEKMLAATQQPTRAEMGREAFLDKVWEWKGEYGGTIINQLKRLGASADWSRNAFTMAGAPGDPKTGHENSANFHDAVLKVFVDLYNKGLIYRGKRLVNWDPHFETAISDLEVENIEVDGHFWHFKYPLAGGETYIYREKDEDGNVILEEERDYISIATTRPETMLGDGAVAVHPDDERYAPIVGKLCEIPVGPKEHRRLIPIITDDYPDPDFGSGAVKITGAHDFNDYGVAKRNNIPLYRLMDTQANMRVDGMAYSDAATRASEISNGADFTEAEVDTINIVPDAYRGLSTKEARKAIVADIDAEGLMIQVEDKKIMQPFCDRSKVVMEPMLTDQWYVDAAKLAGPAMDAVNDGRITIIPEREKKVWDHWLENIEPWCISRQLWWGHQIPVWYGLDLGSDGSFRTGTGELDHVDLLGLLVDGGMLHAGEVKHCAASFEDVIDAFRGEIVDIPEPLSHSAIVEVADKHAAIETLAKSLADYATSQDPTHLVYPVWRDPDVLDTWFSSGLWPIGTLGWPEQTEELNAYFPSSVLITGFDILFFWVARMVMMQLEVAGDIPFHTIYLHGLVRDEKGVKMSKTLGNVVDPLELIDEFGADATRFTMASMAAIGGTLKLSTDRVKGYRNFVTKIWNAARFAEMNGVFDHVSGERPHPTQTLNKWIIGEVAKTRVAIDDALAAYRFNDAATTLYQFIWGTFCDWYVEFSKPLLNGTDEAVADETRATMAWAMEQFLTLLHPIMPFVTEELYGLMGEHAKPLVHAEWPSYGTELVDPTADAELNWVIKLIEDIRSTRQQLHVPAGAKLKLLQIELDAAGQSSLANNLELVLKLARITEITETGIPPKGAVTVPAQGGVFALPIADVIDIAEEISRLEKNMGKLDKEIGGLSGRLNNQKFVANAPEEVVAEAQANLEARNEERAKLDEALSRLRDLS